MNSSSNFPSRTNSSYPTQNHRSSPVQKPPLIPQPPFSIQNQPSIPHPQMPDNARDAPQQIKQNQLSPVVVTPTSVNIVHPTIYYSRHPSVSGDNDFCSYNAHTETFFKNLKLLKIQDILTSQTLKIYHKFRNNKLPYLYIQNSNIHNHNTHSANELHKNRCIHVFAQKSLKLNITNIVNDTLHIILDKIDTHSLNGFTNYVKLFLLQTYQDTCTVPNCYICSLSITLNT